MGLIHIKERGGDQERRFKRALRMAKEAIEEIQQLSEDMEEEFSSRGGGYSGRDGGGYSGRDGGGYSNRGGYGERDDWGERNRSRDGRGRYD